MSDQQYLGSLRDSAADARRTLEVTVSHVDREWSDGARRSFEVDHLTAIRSDARRLVAEVDGIAHMVEEVISQLAQSR
jgi:hypothetical protein